MTSLVHKHVHVQTHCFIYQQHLVSTYTASFMHPSPSNMQCLARTCTASYPYAPPARSGQHRLISTCTTLSRCITALLQVYRHAVRIHCIHHMHALCWYAPPCLNWFPHAPPRIQMQRIVHVHRRLVLIHRLVSESTALSAPSASSRCISASTCVALPRHPLHRPHALIRPHTLPCSHIHRAVDIRMHRLVSAFTISLCTSYARIPHRVPTCTTMYLYAPLCVHVHRLWTMRAPYRAHRHPCSHAPAAFQLTMPCLQMRCLVHMHSLAFT